MKTFLILLGLFIAVNSEQQTYRVKAISQGSYVISKDVVLDPVEKTMMVTIGDVSMYPNYVTSIDFHDFNTPYVALKVVNEGKCFFVTTQETYPTNATLERWQKGILVEKPLLQTQIKRKIADKAVLESIVGPKIAKFCNNYDVYELQLVQKNTRTAALDNVVVACMAYSVGLEKNTYLEQLLQSEKQTGQLLHPDGALAELMTGHVPLDGPVSGQGSKIGPLDSQIVS